MTLLTNKYSYMSSKVAGFFLILVCIFYSAEASCDQNDKVQACIVGLPITDVMEKEKYCSYYQSVLECFDTECCTDPQTKLTTDNLIEEAQRGASYYGLDCTFKCGQERAATASNSNRLSVLYSVPHIAVAVFICIIGTMGSP